MVNPFVKYKGLEFFGTIEFASGGDKKGVDTKRTVDQYTGDVVYRFGNNEKFYIGARYGTVSGKLANADAKAITINRLESSLGWCDFNPAQPTSDARAAARRIFLNIIYIPL